MISASDRKKLKSTAMADNRLVEAILRRWDPIGVEPGLVGSADEYDSYAPQIVSKVKDGCTLEELASHLEHLRSEAMGLGPRNALSRAHSLEFAAEIVASLRPSNKTMEPTR
jgi:hypothetical protein